MQGSANDDTFYSGNGGDFAIGHAGNDYLFGEAGDDTLSGGIGSDELDGGDGFDVLDGGDDSDFITDSSVITADASIIDGGNGDDIIVAQEATITTGVGADQVWAPSETCNLTITDGDAADTLFWNGYQLTGGVDTMVDLEIDQSTGDVQWADFYTLDDQGLRYLMMDTTLCIEGVGVLIKIEDFQQGDFGITFTQNDMVITVSFDENGNYAGYWCNLPDGMFAMNGQQETLADYQNYAQIFQPGAQSAPTTYL